jgi:hypothetical protein
MIDYYSFEVREVSCTGLRPLHQNVTVDFTSFGNLKLVTPELCYINSYSMFVFLQLLTGNFMTERIQNQQRKYV